MLLCDAAQAADGKLYVLGGGWSVTGPLPTPSAIALLFEVPWDQANQRHDVVLELLDQDGMPVTVAGPEGESTVRVAAELEVGRPAGLPPGSPLSATMAINVGALPLPPGGRFEWRLSVDEESDQDWRLPFSVRPMPV